MQSNVKSSQVQASIASLEVQLKTAPVPTMEQTQTSPGSKGPSLWGSVVAIAVLALVGFLYGTSGATCWESSRHFSADLFTTECPYVRVAESSLVYVSITLRHSNCRSFLAFKVFHIQGSLLVFSFVGVISTFLDLVGVNSFLHNPVLFLFVDDGGIVDRSQLSDHVGIFLRKILLESLSKFSSEFCFISKLDKEAAKAMNDSFSYRGAPFLYRVVDNDDAFDVELFNTLTRNAW
jgi:hypothetical protein